MANPSDCPYPSCEWTGPHRPYARKRDGIPSVSTIAGLADDKGGMAWAASGIAASYAIHHVGEWGDLHYGPGGGNQCTEDIDGFCKACRHVRGEFDRRWKQKAAVGSHVHHLVADMAAGLEVEPGDGVGPYLDAWDRFVIEHWPSWVLLESTIRCNGLLGYRGQFDAVADLTVDGVRESWLIDWKTGRFHAFSQTLQLAGYRYSDDITRWDAEGKEVAVRKMMPVKHCGVVLLKPDGEFELVELPAGPAAYSAFMKLRAVYDFRAEMDLWERNRG